MAYNYVESTGIIVPDTDTTLTEVQNEWTEAFPNIDLTPSTPQGIMITAEVLNRDGSARLAADVANQITPDYAGGIFLDAICALSGITRISATFSTVTASLTGTLGTVVPTGSIASTPAGDQFELISAVTIPNDGNFQAVESGAVPCAIGELTEIVDTVLGWTGVTNAVAATLGTSQESDLALWSRRRKTLAAQGVGTDEAVISGLYLTDGVQSLVFRENVEATTEIIDGISMKPHSIYVCVNGGTDADVARSILDNRSGGSGFNGGTTVPTTAASGQVIDVQFDRPTSIPFLVRVTVRLFGAAGDVSNNIQTNILNWSNGLIAGEDGLVVGGDISPFEIAGAAAQITGVYVVMCEIALSSTGIYQATEIAIAIDEIGTLSPSSITVVTV